MGGMGAAGEDDGDEEDSDEEEWIYYKEVEVLWFFRSVFAHPVLMHLDCRAYPSRRDAGVRLAAAHALSAVRVEWQSPALPFSGREEAALEVGVVLGGPEKGSGE